MEKLNVGLVSKTYFYVSYWAALQRGMFSAAGLDVHSVMLGNASQIEPLETGRLDVAMATPEGVLQNTAAGGRVRCIAGHTGRLSHFIIAQPRFRKIEDLRGALVGILSMTEGTFFHVQSVLAAHGLKYPDDYQVKETGGAPPRHKALIEKTIDMGFQSIPLAYAEESLGFSNLGDVSDYVPDWQFNTVNAHLDRAGARRDAVTRFLRVMLEANGWVYENRVEAAAVAAREMDISQEHAERGWDYYTGKGVLTRNLEMNLKGLARVIESQRSAGLLPREASSDPQAYMAGEFLNAARSK